MTARELEVVTYSVADAVAVFGISRATLYRLRKAGRIKMHRLGGRTLIFKHEMIEAIRGIASDANRSSPSHSR